jgi:hypothetical protein
LAAADGAWGLLRPGCTALEGLPAFDMDQTAANSIRNQESVSAFERGYIRWPEAQIWNNSKCSEMMFAQLWIRPSTAKQVTFVTYHPQSQNAWLSDQLRRSIIYWHYGLNKYIKEILKLADCAKSTVCEILHTLWGEHQGSLISLLFHGLLVYWFILRFLRFYYFTFCFKYFLQCF